ncbi:hypothetical protein IW138_003249 [Coemansia sp. RSA 986]|nr:hypothetical protein IW138_003249 [Coemansia sp. RSA 986]
MFASFGEKHDKQVPGEPYTVGYSARGLLIDGTPRVLTAGSIHYPRSAPGMWGSLMKKAKQGGLNTIDTYVFWNMHEPTKRHYDFATDRANLPLFLETAHSFNASVPWVMCHQYSRLAAHKQFDPSVYLEKRFFGEVFLHLTKRKARPNVKAEIQEYRRVIRKHLDAYKEAAGITEFDIANPNQTAQFEAARIYTAYVNNIQTKLGQYLRRAVNVLLKTRERKRDLEEAMKGRTADEINKAYENQIWKPGLKLKEAIKHRNTVLPVITVGDKNIGDMLEPVLTAYDNDYRFEEEGIYYDIKAHPKKHFKAFYCLAVLLEMNEYRSFQCFPLRKSFVPMHIKIDTMVLCRSIMDWSYNAKSPIESYWYRFLNEKSRALRTRNGFRFYGTIQSDGVSVGSGLTAPVESAATGSLSEDQPKKPRKPRKREKPGEKKSGEFTYIHELSPEQLASMKNPIFMDPGCQDIVFGMTDESTSEEKALFRYTRSQKAKETRTTHYRKLREKVKKEHPDSNEIKAAEARLAAFSCTSVLPGKYEQYVRTRAAVWPVLSRFYTNTMTTSKNRNNPQPIHRKLRQSAHIKQQQADEQLAKSIRATCDDEKPTVILGNWSVPMARYHEPIRGVGFQRMLRKKGCRVYLIDEFRTSKACPNCLTGTLKKFLKVPNPRPYQRKKMKEVLCHGLLKCTNEICMGPMEMDGVLTPRSRIYNRDLAAVLNFRHIFHGLRDHGETPERFCRSQPTAAATADEQQPKKKRKTYLDKYHRDHPGFPDMWTEMWPAWFQRWGEPAPHRPIEDVAYAVAKWYAHGGTYVAYYMYQGGTNFGRTSGPFILTSYDYEGFLDEYGLENWPKYLHLAKLHNHLLDHSDIITGNPVPESQTLAGSPKTYAKTYGSSTDYLAFLINVDANSDVSVRYDGVDLDLPRWSVTLVRKRAGDSRPTILYNSATLSSDVKRAQKNPAYFEHISSPALDDESQSHRPIMRKDSVRWRPIDLPMQQDTSSLDAADPVYSRPPEHISITDDTTDYLWYRTTVDVPATCNSTTGTLVLRDAGDVASVYLDDQYMGMRYGQQDRLATFTFDVAGFFTAGSTKQKVELRILSQTMGMAHNQRHMEAYARGLLGSIELCGHDITDGKWQVQPGLEGEANPLDAPTAQLHPWMPYQPKTDRSTGHMKSIARWYAIDIDATALVANEERSANDEPRYGVDMSSMTKGQLWINGHHLGRYWLRRAPAKESHKPCQQCGYGGWYWPDNVCRQGCGEYSQQYYHLPRSYLSLPTDDDEKPPLNTLYVLEEIGGKPEHISIAKRVSIVPHGDNEGASWVCRFAHVLFKTVLVLCVLAFVAGLGGALSHLYWKWRNSRQGYEQLGNGD